MKKCLIISCALLFSQFVSCSSTRRHAEQQQGSRWERSDSLASNYQHQQDLASAQDSTSLGAALQSQLAGEGRSTEVDTSRTVIVTEFGADGLPVRQTETRQNATFRSSAWSLEQQLQIDAYLMQLRELNEQYDASIRTLMALRNNSRSDTLSYESEREPAILPAVVKWSVGIEIALAWIVMLAICAVMIVKKMKSYK